MNLQKEVLAHLTSAAGNNNVADITGVALACMAFRTYRDKIISGWYPLLTANVNSSGFDAISLWHPASKQVVISIRGADGFLSQKDWLKSIGKILKISTGQIPDAVEFLKDSYALAVSKYDPSGIYLTGTSLGGGLADGLAVIARSVLAPLNFGESTISAVVTASAGFMGAFQDFATAGSLSVDKNDTATHYVRAADFVPGHPGRKIFGREVEIASIYKGILERPYKSHSWEYDWTSDLIENHNHEMHFKYFGVPATSHIWRNTKDQYLIQSGAEPQWKRTPKRPANF